LGKSLVKPIMSDESVKAFNRLCKRKVEFSFS
ncbi:MAG: hypothetical protein ACI8X3_001126, partial [Saprospiraceae bacterium]